MQAPVDRNKMRTIIIKVDLDCSRCHRKIEKVLDRIREKGEFVIDDIEYDEKNNRVIVKGPFDPDRLADKLCCKACKIIKEIEIVELPPPPKKEELAPPSPEKETKPETPPPAVVEPACEPKPEPEPPKKEEAPPPPEPETKPPVKVVEIPYLWPCPYPFPAWPSDCCCHHGHGGCHCCSCGKQEPPAPPPPQYPQYMMPQYPQCPPPSYPCGGYKIVCEEDPSYACAIM